MDKVNLLLIGLGPHAKRIYYPICRKDGNKFNFRLVYAVDVEEKKSEIQSYLKQKGDSFTQIYYIQPKDRTYGELSSKVKTKLDEIVEQFNIKGVIISTEPLAHMVYARWALRRGLSVLMDKPISSHRHISTDPEAVEEIMKDYYELVRLYQRAQKKYGLILFSLMAQRRWHPAYRKIKSLIEEVFKKTGCPVTSIQTFHADGQWRLPSEIVDIDYHSFNQGYGKCSHSGYHFFDIVPWFLEAGETKGKSINNVDIFTNFLRPKDFFKQLNLNDYRRIFPNFDKHNHYSKDELNKFYAGYGEIDAFSSFAFRHNERVLTLGQINLAHNSFSQRGWVSTKNRDLYKGNGRLRHESHFIEQGPFQAVSFASYQSKEVDPNRFRGVYEIGGEYHLDIHVFRNTALFPQWKTYEKISVKDLNIKIMVGKSRGHQEDARRQAVLELVKFLHGKKIKPVSELTDHLSCAMQHPS